MISPQMVTFLGADVLQNARGSSLARISLFCGVAFHEWCDALLSVVASGADRRWDPEGVPCICGIKSFG